MHGISCRYLPLASPGGKLPDLTALRNRQGWLMRGGDRLVNECSWMNGICFSFHHSTYCCGDFKRSPPLISHDKISVPRCRYFIVTASPRGKPRTQKLLANTFQQTTLLRELRVAKLATPTGVCQCTTDFLYSGTANGRLFSFCHWCIFVNVKYEQKMTFFRQITPGGIC